MFSSLARLVLTRSRAVLAGAVLFVLLSAVTGYGVSDALHGLGATDPTAESTRAAALLDEQSPGGRPNLVLLVTSDVGVDSPRSAVAGLAIVGRLASEPAVVGVNSYWQSRSTLLRSTDGRQALITARITGDILSAARVADEISSTYQGTQGGVSVQVGGEAAVAAQAQRIISDDLATSELIALPITLLVLIVIFGSVVAALLPFAVGLIAMVGTSGVLRIISGFADVSIFALNLTTALSLGLAIDYALLIVRRFEEERSRGAAPHRALVTTLRTAGRTVAFSAATVAVSLTAMLVFRLDFLRSFAYVGVSVVLLAAAAALLVVPALLVFLGDRLRFGSLVRGGFDSAWWQRVTTVVMRFAPVFAFGTTMFLVVLAIPFLGVQFGQVDDRQLPAQSQARVVQDDIRGRFSGAVTGHIEIVTTVRSSALTGYATTLSRLPGVTRVHRVGAGSLLVTSASEPVSPESQDLVRAIRAIPAPFPVLVGGTTAELVDTQRAVADGAPVALTLIVIATLVVLFVMTRSILLPIKTVVVNALSLTATFGAVVWVFQDGHLAGLLGFTPVGAVDTTLPVLMFCLGFGLTMDYGVFVLSRIQEEYLSSGDNRRAVAVGIRRSAGIITAAAAILAVVLIAVGTSRVMNMKMVGLGTALAVVIDATVVRCLLVPSVMALAGRANWWAPRWLGGR